MTHVDPRLRQEAFRIRDDDGSETAATWLEDEDINHVLVLAGANDQIRIRIVIEEYNGDPWTTDLPVEIYVSKDGGAYEDMATAEAANRGCDRVLSSQFAHNDSTSEQLTGGNGSYHDVGVMMEGSNAYDPLNATQLNANSHCEVEAVFEFIDADTANGTTFDFRVYQTDDTAINLYTVTPRVTISKPSGGYHLPMMGVGR